MASLRCLRLLLLIGVLHRCDGCFRSCPTPPRSDQCTTSVCSVGHAPNMYCATDGNSVMDFGNECYRQVAHCVYNSAGLNLTNVVCLEPTAACPQSCPLYYTAGAACGVDPAVPGNPIRDYGNECGFGLAQCKSGNRIQRVACDQMVPNS